MKRQPPPATRRNKARRNPDAPVPANNTQHQVGCYKEVLRVLKPGGCFAGYEWCATDQYDPANPAHKDVMAEIELGNGLPDVRTCAETIESLKKAGFEVLDSRDLALDVSRLFDQVRFDLFWFLPFGLRVVGRPRRRVRAAHWATAAGERALNAGRTPC